MSSLNILIVDDNHDLSDCLAILLEDQGYKTSVAYNGEDAITMLQGEYFDLAIIDVKLPGMNGVEVLRAIRKIEPKTQGILMTGYRVDQLLKESIDDSVSVLRKPFPMDTLLNHLQQLKKRGIVLVADDDPEFAESTGQYLNEQGYKVLIANTGEDAIDRVINESVDVLVLDLKMPVVHGLDVYLDIKQRGITLPTIIVTGYAAQEAEKLDVLRSMSVTGCLFKPFNPEELLIGIDNIMKGAVKSPLTIKNNQAGNTSSAL